MKNNKGLNEAVDELLNSYEDNPYDFSVMKLNVAKFLYENKSKDDNKTFKDYVDIVENAVNKKLNLN
jgi:hypothetical protein